MRKLGRWLGGTILVSALAFSACGAGSERAAEAKAWVQAGATLLDVRSPQEFGGRHLPGAVNVPVGELRDRLAEVPKDKKVVVYCRSGTRSAAAASVLREKGYEVLDLGGIGNWEG